MEENIASIIRHGETSRVQFKLNFTSQKEIAREISAFANSHGGIIIFGVEDKTGRVAGLSTPPQEFRNRLYDRWHW